jgi:hypothetical protein
VLTGISAVFSKSLDGPAAMRPNRIGRPPPSPDDPKRTPVSVWTGELSIEAAPATVAEMLLFDGGPYPASVWVVEPVVSLFINKSDFQQVCRRFHPAVRPLGSR